MSSTYSPTPVELGDLTLVEDGDGPGIKAADVRPAFEALADGYAFLAQRGPARIDDLTAANGTWICPDGVTHITLEWCGAGGSGSGTSPVATTVDNFYPGGGGGCGAALVRKTIPVVPGTQYDYVNGQGAIGADGADSTFTIHSGAEVARARGAMACNSPVSPSTVVGTRAFCPGGSGTAGARSPGLQLVAGSDFAQCLTGAGGGGYGTSNNNTLGAEPGHRSETGFAGGAAGTSGTDASTRRGGGGGGGGGGGPFGPGGTGGNGGNANGAGAGGNGTDGAAAAANTGAGGGGGGAGGTGSSGFTTGTAGQAGGSGRTRVIYAGAQAVFT